MADDKEPVRSENGKSMLQMFSPTSVQGFIQKTPCARNAFLYGIAGGMVTGVSAFLYTKHIRRSCDFAVASFSLVSIGSWEWCRYSNRKEKEEIEKTVELLTKYSNARENGKADPKSA